ncbi:MAG: TonB-dependent receptor [Gammaproteobacteria bacterium]|nr:TonB-dependent receptor [Gammaproteobacteria bacterium]
MRVDEVRARFTRRVGLFAITAAGICLLATPQVFAQSNDEGRSDADESGVEEEITVTGSRLKRDTYSSIAPLQVISGEVSREIGSIDPSTILQEAPAAGGQQVDITYQGFVLDNGPGASTIDLRGLGAERTLVLINGRRAAPVGVEGAPFALDLNVIPSSLVQRYEVLLDGASSVYGSDAVAGVANIILRKDFDGLEVELYSSVPKYTGGANNTIAASWGYNGDRGVIGFGVDYSRLDPVDRGDRPWSAGCESYYDVDENGQIRTEFIGYQADYGMKASPCRIGFGSQRVFDNEAGLFGSIYYTDGQTNTGIPNFSEATLFDAVLDINGDGVPDVDFTDYFVTSQEGVEHLLPEVDRLSAMAYGEYTLTGEANITPYFELNYNERETSARSAPGGTIGVNPLNVPGDNPFNPCNPNGINGVDCGLAWDSVLTNPNFIENFRDRYEGLCAQFGFGRDACTPPLFGIFPGGPAGPISLEPQVSVRGDRDNVKSDVSQLRAVAGVRGDIPMLNFGSLDNWSFDVAVVYSDSSGDSVRRGINEERLRYSFNTTVADPVTGAITCGNGSDGCVPVNMFAPSLYQELSRNDFATQAERDYVFDVRAFDTGYEQTLGTAILTGDLFSLPAGDVAAAFGYEYRNDTIKSIPNDVARDGTLLGFFRDLGATGEKDTKEYFAEVEIPVLANVTAFEELTVNVSSRHTKDEFYGGAWTYSAKLGWRPIDSLFLKASVGTSYRAPNLRENYLAGTSGFRGLFDPCVTPEDAIGLDPNNPGGFVYDPTGDTRTQAVLDNCVNAGVDPTNLGITTSGQSISVYSVEVLRGVGQTDLVEEKSDSFTAGFAWEQPFFEAFDLTVGATYYEIEVRDEIITLFSQFSIDGCYEDAELDSPYCRNISRNLAGDGLINGVDEAFLNRDSLKTRGVDVNLALDWPTQVMGRAVDFSADLSFNRKLEFSDVFIDPVNGDISTDSDLGDFGLPEWEGQMLFRADVGDYRATWSTRYIGSVEIDPDVRAVNDFDNWLEGAGLTCLGPLAGDVNCRPVGEADNYFRHDMSVYYRGDVWTLGIGARNVLNEAPPKVDSRVVFSAFNTPFGAGYDVNGRSYFFNVAARFQ